MKDKPNFFGYTIHVTKDKYICVFCSAQEVKPVYLAAATSFAELLVKNGFNLVFGGSDKGLMHVVSQTVKRGGGKLVGISIDWLQGVVRKDLDELVVTKSLGERKETMLKRSDAIIALPGGIGTLDECMEIIEHKKHGHHNKPIVILNTDNFYSGLKQQLQKMYDEGFLPKPLAELVYFADTPQDAISYIIENTH